jgi:hypothetical protein
VAASLVVEKQRGLIMIVVAERGEFSPIVSVAFQQHV